MENARLEKVLKLLMCSKYGKGLRKIFYIFRPRCLLFPGIVHILSDGSVTTCCNDPFGENRLGSVYENDISEIWNGSIKKIVLSGDLYDLKRCRDCIPGADGLLLSKKADYLKWRGMVYRHPEYIQLEVMGRCNCGCCDTKEVYKYRNNNETKPDLDKIYENIKSFLPKIKQLNLFNYGEPLLHEGFCDFVKKCRSNYGSLSLLVSTNGMLMDEKVSACLIEQKVNNIHVSIHGGPGTENMLKYSKYGNDYGTVLANIKRLVNMKKAHGSSLPCVQVNTVLFNWNDTDELIDRLRRDVKAAGADTISWRLDCGRGDLERSSMRFAPGSDELKKLNIETNAFFSGLKQCEVKHEEAVSIG